MRSYEPFGTASATTTRRKKLLLTAAAAVATVGGAVGVAAAASAETGPSTSQAPQADSSEGSANVPGVMPAATAEAPQGMTADEAKARTVRVSAGQQAR